MVDLRKRTLERVKYRQTHIDDILAVLYPQLERPLDECDVLDVGCAYGALTIPIAERVRYIKGFDISDKYIQEAIEVSEEQKLKNVEFEVLSVHDLNEKDRYDVVICSDVIEHVDRQEEVLRKIIDALKVGGVLYISTNNKYWPIEGHKGLPFLTYLPRNIANRYVRFMRGRGNDYEGYYLLSYFGTRRLLDKFSLEYEFKPPNDPHNFLYKVGKRFVLFSEFFWIFANAFQIIAKKSGPAN
ncbi:MAG: class I SAM-dependent methyltransferase [Thermoplasmata archaeon]|nr:class I SAM-dependent methyltransferase [Thermoplasmata archaeon]